MQSTFLYSVLSMGGLGALLALGLGIASKAFHVERDPKIDEVNEALPGANCGACGYAGCDAFAEAVANGDAPVTGCPVGGDSVAERLAEIMGAEAEESEEQVAQVLCKGGTKETARAAEYEGIETCTAASVAGISEKRCSYGCLGLGDCAHVCPFDAITMSSNGLPEVDPDKCTACNKCVEKCPHDLFVLSPVSGENHIRCSSHDGGKFVRGICEVGCIACTQCVRVCPVDAIEMQDNLAVLDYEKCINCGLCAEKCPTNTIDFYGEKIKHIEITDDCVGCTRCAPECPVDAISGELKEKHIIDQEKCIKCGICYDVCKVDGAIEKEY